jgi:hypothetical protein
MVVNSSVKRASVLAHVMSELLEQGRSGANGFAHLGRRLDTGQQGMVEHADAQLPRVATDLGGEGSWKRGGRIGIAGHGSRDHIEQTCCVANRSGDDSVHGRAGPRIADVGTERHAGSGRFESDESAFARRDTDRATAITGMRGRHHPRRDCGGRSARGSARGMFGVPRIPRGPVRFGLGCDRRAELGGVRATDEQQARGAESSGDVIIAVGAPVRALEERGTGVVRVADAHRGKILEHERDAAERPVGQGTGRLGLRLCEPFVDDGVQRGIHRLDARDRGVDEFEW